MEIRTIKNYNLETEETVFGVSIRVDGGHRYCKYPAGHQGYKTMSEATEAKEKIMEQIRNGAHLEYGNNGSVGINKSEYVKIVD